MEYVDKRPYIAIIVVLALVSLGLGGFLIYDKFINLEDDTETIIDSVSVNLNVLYQVHDTLNKFDEAFNKTDSNYFEYLYKERTLDAKKMDNKTALFAAIKSDLIKTGVDSTTLAGVAKNNFKKMYGDELKYDPTSIDGGANYKLNYDSTTKKFTYKIPASVNNRANEYIAKETKTKIEEGKIIVTRKIFFVEYSGLGANIYNEKGKRKVGEVNLDNDEVNPDEVIAKYGSKLNTYEYTFVENKKDNYTFYRIEKTR